MVVHIAMGIARGAGGFGVGAIEVMAGAAGKRLVADHTGSGRMQGVDRKVMGHGGDVSRSRQLGQMGNKAVWSNDHR